MSNSFQSTSSQGIGLVGDLTLEVLAGNLTCLGQVLAERLVDVRKQRNRRGLQRRHALLEVAALDEALGEH